MHFLFSCSNLVENKSVQKDFDKNYTLKNIGWKSSNESEIIIIAIHGYNDYSNAFKDPALFFLNLRLIHTHLI